MFELMLERKGETGQKKYSFFIIGRRDWKRRRRIYPWRGFKSSIIENMKKEDYNIYECMYMG